jgi:hypothetical protein
MFCELANEIWGASVTQLPALWWYSSSVQLRVRGDPSNMFPKVWYACHRWHAEEFQGLRGRKYISTSSRCLMNSDIKKINWDNISWFGLGCVLVNWFLWKGYPRYKDVCSSENSVSDTCSWGRELCFPLRDATIPQSTPPLPPHSQPAATSVPCHQRKTQNY